MASHDDSMTGATFATEYGKYCVNASDGAPLVFKVVGGLTRGIRPSLNGRMAFSLGLNVDRRKRPFSSNPLKGAGLSFCVRPRDTFKFLEDNCEIAVCKIPRAARTFVRVVENEYIKFCSKRVLAGRAASLEIVEFLTVAEFISRRDFFADDAAIDDALQVKPVTVFGFPKKFRTPERIAAAVKYCSGYLRLVRPEEMTYEMCLAAVKAYGEMIEHVPARMRTPELCLAAVKSNHRGYVALKHLTRAQLTPEVVKAAFDASSSALIYIPRDLLTVEMCEKAVKDSWLNIVSVPRDLLTEKMCLVAVSDHADAIERILRVAPEKCTPRVVIAALKQAPRLVESLPDSIITSEVRDNLLECVKASLCGDARDRKRHSWRDESRWHESDIAAFKELGVSDADSELSEDSDAGNEYSHRYSMPADERGPSRVERIISEYIEKCKNPSVYLTPDVCEYAVKLDPVAIRSLVQKYHKNGLDYRTPEVCLAAVSKDGSAIQFLPTGLRTPEVCAAAIARTPSAIRFLTRDELARLPDVVAGKQPLNLPAVTLSASTTASASAAACEERSDTRTESRGDTRRCPTRRRGRRGKWTVQK